MCNQIGLWSKRWSVAQGNHWKHERDCLPENAQAWLEVFRKDEPEVTFVISHKRPKV